ncbi:MAG TPA: hypothetical protein VGF45_07675 [Polyangia bacterium]
MSADLTVVPQVRAPGPEVVPVSATPPAWASRRRFLHRSFAAALAVGVAAGGWPSAAQAAKPEDVFKGKIIITKDRLPTRFASESAFVAAIRKASVDKVWPTEEKGNDHALWTLEYIGFFAKPLNDTEVSVKFWEASAGSQRYIAGDEQYISDKTTRVFAARITLGKPEFEANKKYLMTMESRGRVIASTSFWLRGKGPNYSGKVEFSDDEAKQK